MKHYSMEEIYLYLDGEMPPMEKTLFEDHILVCKDCAHRLQRAREFLEKTKLEEEEPTVDVASLVMNKIDKKRKLLPLVYAFFILLVSALTVPVFFGLDRAVFFYYVIFDYFKKLFLVFQGFLSLILSARVNLFLVIAAGAMLVPIYFGLKKIWRST